MDSYLSNGQTASWPTWVVSVAQPGLTLNWSELQLKPVSKKGFCVGDLAGRRLLDDSIVEVGTVRGFEHGKVLFESKGRTILVHENELIKIDNG